MYICCCCFIKSIGPTQVYLGCILIFLFFSPQWFWVLKRRSRSFTCWWRRSVNTMTLSWTADSEEEPWLWLTARTSAHCWVPTSVRQVLLTFSLEQKENPSMGGTRQFQLAGARRWRLMERWVGLSATPRSSTSVSSPGTKCRTFIQEHTWVLQRFFLFLELFWRWKHSSASSICSYLHNSKIISF